MQQPCDDDHDCRPYYNEHANFYGVLHDHRCPNHPLHNHYQHLDAYKHLRADLLDQWSAAIDRSYLGPDDADEHDANNARLLDYGNIEFHNRAWFERNYRAPRPIYGCTDLSPVAIIVAGYGEDAASAAQHIVWGYSDWRFAEDGD